LGHHIHLKEQSTVSIHGKLLRPSQ
jgi:hypothetical protein